MYLKIRYALEQFLAFFVLLLILPLLIVIGVCLYFSVGYPVLFLQERGGFQGRTIRVIKFKTMTDERNKDGELLPDSMRTTKFGDFLRKCSLDELPQLVNVILGEMSVIGPRPLVVSYLPLYNERQRRRHDVRPGITGWAQVNGRNAISWEKKFELDVYYVENASLFLDVKIVFLTILRVLNSKDINCTSADGMHPFRGSKVLKRH